jgi:hypothetical protein
MKGTTQKWIAAAISAFILLGDAAWSGASQQATATNPVAGNAAAIR